MTGNFVTDMHVGMKVKTPKGNGIIKIIIEDIHCHVNVTLEDGTNMNFMLYRNHPKTLDLIRNLDYAE